MLILDLVRRRLDLELESPEMDMLEPLGLSVAKESNEWKERKIYQLVNQAKHWIYKIHQV